MAIDINMQRMFGRHLVNLVKILKCDTPFKHIRVASHYYLVYRWITNVNAFCNEISCLHAKHRHVIMPSLNIPALILSNGIYDFIYGMNL